MAKSLVEGTSVWRLAREFYINANQAFTWRRQFAYLQRTENDAPAAELLQTRRTLPANKAHRRRA